jgi:hypothetical protein
VEGIRDSTRGCSLHDLKEENSGGGKSCVCVLFPQVLLGLHLLNKRDPFRSDEWSLFEQGVVETELEFNNNFFF